jgi:predicted RNA-binding protein with PUA-like domain
MKYFLVKSDPDTYSVDNFASDKKTTWDGVRNPQAVNFLKSMNSEDMVLVYHSQGECAIVGLAKVIGNSRPDPNDKRSWLIDLEFVERFQAPFVTLQELKATGKFPDFRLITNSRLSVMDVPEIVVNYLRSKGISI